MILKLSFDVGEINDLSDEPRKVWRVTEEGLKKYKQITSERVLFLASKESSHMYEEWWNHLENNLKTNALKKESLV